MDFNLPYSTKECIDDNTKNIFIDFDCKLKTCILFTFYSWAKVVTNEKGLENRMLLKFNFILSELFPAHLLSV